MYSSVSWNFICELQNCWILECETKVMTSDSIFQLPSHISHNLISVTDLLPVGQHTRLKSCSIQKLSFVHKQFISAEVIHYKNECFIHCKNELMSVFSSIGPSSIISFFTCLIHICVLSGLSPFEFAHPGPIF